MLNVNPLLRPTYSDLIMHPWLVNASEEITEDAVYNDMAMRK